VGLRRAVAAGLGHHAIDVAHEWTMTPPAVLAVSASPCSRAAEDRAGSAKRRGPIPRRHCPAVKNG